jgi:hypothetical protein
VKTKEIIHKTELIPLGKMNYKEVKQKETIRKIE